MPPRVDVTAHLISSSTGSDLIDSAAEQRWRHSLCFVGFDADGVGGGDDLTSLDRDAMADETGGDGGGAEALFVRELVSYRESWLCARV